MMLTRGVSVRSRVVRVLLLAVAFGVCANAGPLSDMLNTFHDLCKAGLATVIANAKALFVLLSVIGIAWDGATLWMDHREWSSYAGALFRRILWFLTFWTLLINGPAYTTAIVSSLQFIGTRTAGVPSLNPEDILGLGWNLMGTLIKGSADFGFFSGKFWVGAAMFVAAIGIWLAFVLLVVQFVTTLVLWYVVGNLGAIFLGFGGSRWTADYAKRYYEMAVAIGIKFLTIMFIIGVGLRLGPTLLAMAAAAPSDASPDKVAFEIFGLSLMMVFCAWLVPKFFSTIMSGMPGIGGGDFWAGISAMVAAGMAAMGGVAAVGSAMGGGMAGALAGSAAGAGSSASSVTSAGSGESSPPSGGGGGGSGGEGSSGGSEWTGPGSDAWAASQAAAMDGGGGSSGSDSGGGESGGVAGGGGEAPAPAEAPASTGGSGGGGGGGSAFRAAHHHASSAAMRGQQVLRTLAQDGGGHGGGAPGFGG